MLIIIVTVVTQGFLVDNELRGSVKGLLFINDGFFEAVGVISFGMLHSLYSGIHSDWSSICVPS